MHKKIIFRLAWCDGLYVFFFFCMRMVCKLVIAQMMFCIWLYLFLFFFFFWVHIKNLPEMCLFLLFSSLVWWCFFFIYLNIYSFCIELSPVGLVGSTNGGVKRAHTLNDGRVEKKQRNNIEEEKKIGWWRLGDGYNLWTKRTKK